MVLILHANFHLMACGITLLEQSCLSSIQRKVGIDLFGNATCHCGESSSDTGQQWCEKLLLMCGLTMVTKSDDKVAQMLNILKKNVKKNIC